LMTASRPPFPGGWTSIDLTPDELSLRNTLPVGQTFEQEQVHEQEIDDPEEDEPLEEYSRAIPNPDRVILLRQTKTKIWIVSVLPNSAAEREERDKAWFADYFQAPLLPLPLMDQYAHWKELDPLLFGKAYDRDELPKGVRVVRQEGWECLISFITSSANNVPRITSLLHKLQAHFSPVLLTLPHPGPEALANASASAIPVGPEEQPLELETQDTEYRFGYRAGFIVNSLALLVAEHGNTDLGEGTVEGTITTRGVQAFLRSLRYEDEEERGKWRTELIRLKGVGRKVADCIGLMSMDKPNVVPIDTHLQQIAARHPQFPSKLKHKSTSSEPVYNQVQEFLTKLWGGPAEQTHLPGNGFAGWAQAVMFAADL
ncbi:DNA glycosylase, partial [Filobasidium floriforme]|uniref:DNA glycosylase n=1 Tax=Filobasidium floriforme TaxID=5210 RepID=UPI001E8E67A1